MTRIEKLTFKHLLAPSVQQGLLYKPEEMADKEATIYVIDVAKSMGVPHNGRNESDLNQVKEYVLDALGEKVLAARKTDRTGVIMARSDDKDSDNGVMVFAELQQFTYEWYQKCERDINPSGTNDGDLLWAISKAMHVMDQTCKHLKYIKTINVLSNFDGHMPFEPEEMDSLVNFLHNKNIQLNIYGMDFADKQLGTGHPWVKEGEREKLQLYNEKCLRQVEENLCDHPTGMRDRRDTTWCTMEPFTKVYSSLSEPAVKRIRPVRSFKGQLTLGSIDNADRSRTMSIEVECYPSTRKAAAVQSKMYTVSKGSEDEKHEEPVELSFAREYMIKDESNPDGETVIDETDREEGYLYGSEIVTLTDEDKVLFKPDTKPILEIIAFASKDQVPRWYEMSQTDFVCAADDYKAELALASFAWALEQERCYVIARYVQKVNTPVKMVLLTPFVEDKRPKCLIMAELPFSEDVRFYRFPSLSVPKTIKGKPIQKGTKEWDAKVPSEEMNRLMEDCIDQMTLVDKAYFEDDEENLHITGDPNEIAKPEDTFNPLIHRVKNVIKHCAKIPNQEDYTIPPVLPILKRYAYPPPDYFENAEPALEELKKLFNIQKVLTPKERKELEKQNESKPEVKTELDIDALLSGDSKDKPDNVTATDADDDYVHVKQESQDTPQVTERAQSPEKPDISVPDHVSEENTIPDLKNILQSKLKTEQQKRDACNEACSIVLDMFEGLYVKDDIILERYSVLRKQCLYYGFDELFQEFKSKVLKVAPTRLKNRLPELDDEDWEVV